MKRRLDRLGAVKEKAIVGNTQGKLLEEISMHLMGRGQNIYTCGSLSQSSDSKRPFCGLSDDLQGPDGTQKENAEWLVWVFFNDKWPN